MLSKKILKHVQVIKQLENHKIIIKKFIDIITIQMKKGGKVLLCGNGGSAADAQHLAAEFLIRLSPDLKRKPLPAISLATDISTLTACGNDFKFENIFERTFLALHGKNDVILAISTSGNSKNILKVLKTAKLKKVICLGFLGKNGGNAKKLCNEKIIVNSNNVATIQEAHIFLGHYIFEQVEKNLI